MPLIQLDLFGWHEQSQRALPGVDQEEVTADVLAAALIKYFGHWVKESPRLLADDTTVCDTLIGIHKRFSRRQLRLVYKTSVWDEAWEQFNAYYLTHRSRGNAYFGEWLSATMPELHVFRQQALSDSCGGCLTDVDLIDRELCVYGYDGGKYLVATPTEFQRLSTWYKPYWADIGAPIVTIENVEILIYAVDDHHKVEFNDKYRRVPAKLHQARYGSRT
ncbi:hypothetical protein [Alicyclobacillus sp. ALC3]|uniref:hypothetical protein n=1 Tax=Alicyclobacillus sp. ALC3 TaxID=2796143 RepID=UPI002378D354|nr:hypothetical protein [Alicyclobacillus sp. ALC3]WDL99720.1 hypothetical protein JC200_24115 [Alicyclobacillus sp. ALC3]